LLVPDLPLPLIEDVPDLFIKLVHFFGDLWAGLLTDFIQRLDMFNDDCLNLRLLWWGKLECMLHPSNHLLIDGLEAVNEVFLTTADCRQGQPCANDNTGYQNDKPEKGKFPAMRAS